MIVLRDPTLPRNATRTIPPSALADKRRGRQFTVTPGMTDTTTEFIWFAGCSGVRRRRVIRSPRVMSE